MGVPISLAASTGLALLEADHVRLRHTRSYRLAAAHVTRALLVQAYVTVAMCMWHRHRSPPKTEKARETEREVCLCVAPMGW